MKQNISSAKKYSRRTRALLWLGLMLGVIGTLLYFEQVAVIYVLSTLALILLLLVVAFADLERVGFDDEPKDSELASEGAHKRQQAKNQF